MMVLAAASIPALQWARKAEGLRGKARSGLPVLLALAAFFSALLFRWTRPVWLLLPRFWMAQFPWRSLFVISLALAVSIVTASYAMRRAGLWLGVAVAVWLALGGPF